MWEGEQGEAILQLLSSSRGRLFSCKEISRTIDRHRCKEDGHWARNDLRRLVDHGRVKQDNSGFFFVPKEERQL